MKKSNLIRSVMIILLSVIFFKSHAQFAMNYPGNTNGHEIVLSAVSDRLPTMSVNGKAEKNFNKAYQQVSDVEWSTLSDKTLMCRFYMNNILHRAFYTTHGQWKSTVFSYDGSRLDKGVSDRIKSIYYNSWIVCVDQIDLVSGGTIYVVEIHDEKSIKKLRVDADEIEVIQEFAIQ